jgi:hypothetical protein
MRGFFFARELRGKNYELPGPAAEKSCNYLFPNRRLAVKLFGKCD